MDFYEWRDYGIDKGWISYPVCEFHDTIPMSDDELTELDEHGEICLFVSRYYEEQIGGEK